MTKQVLRLSGKKTRWNKAHFFYLSSTLLFLLLNPWCCCCCCCWGRRIVAKLSLLISGTSCWLVPALAWAWCWWWCLHLAMGNELLLVLSEKRAHVLVLVVAAILLFVIIKNNDDHTVSRHRLPNEPFYQFCLYLYFEICFTDKLMRKCIKKLFS